MENSRPLFLSPSFVALNLNVANKNEKFASADKFATLANSYSQKTSVNIFTQPTFDYSMGTAFANAAETNESKQFY